MKCAEITDKVIEAIESGKYDHIRLNYPNGDMVGHTGVFNAVCCSMEGMDLQLGRLKAAIEKAGGILCLTAPASLPYLQLKSYKLIKLFFCKLD